jgi:hypothetical protein
MTLPPPALLRLAAAYVWENPGAPWDEVAAQVGRSTRQLHRWRRTELWEVAWREAGTPHVERLVPRAVQALVTAWSKGNPSGAVEVLRSSGHLRPATVRVDTGEPALVALHRVLATLPVEIRVAVAEALDRLEED